MNGHLIPPLARAQSHALEAKAMSDVMHGILRDQARAGDPRAQEALPYSQQIQTALRRVAGLTETVYTQHKAD